MFGSALFCAGSLCWAADMFRNYGMAPGDGGALRPAGERAVMAALLATLGLLPFLGMTCYARLYVTRIEFRPPRLHLWTLGLFGKRAHVVDADAVSSVAFHDWAVEPGSPISTPWLTLRVAGRRFPFLIDLAADHADRAALQKLGRRRTRNS
jgi:hypothetical protein